jgi:uncharacterized membrane protein SpoIIM required for sporulation
MRNREIDIEHAVGSTKIFIHIILCVCMRYEEFIDEHEQRWNRLEILSNKIKSEGYTSLSEDELDSFLLLYRRASADLAFIRTHFPDSRTEEFLNSLVAKSHAQLTRTPTTSFSRIFSFYKQTFPQLFARNILFIGMAFLLFMGTATICGIGLHYDREFFMGMSPIPESVMQKRADNGSVGPDLDAFLAPIASSSIMINNIQVGIMTYSSGVALGLGTVFYLFINGVMLGVFSSYFISRGLGIGLLAAILPHGILELAAIFICGGAGLMIGDSIIHPGEQPRSQSIATRGREATQLVVGTIPLFILAGIIEGYFSFRETLSNDMKLTFCIFPAGFLYFYLLRHISWKKSLLSVITHGRNNP